jgi:hypothetical protein
VSAKVVGQAITVEHVAPAVAAVAQLALRTLLNPASLTVVTDPLEIFAVVMEPDRIDAAITESWANLLVVIAPASSFEVVTDSDRMAKAVTPSWANLEVVTAPAKSLEVLTDPLSIANSVTAS